MLITIKKKNFQLTLSFPVVSFHIRGGRWCSVCAAGGHRSAQHQVWFPQHHHPGGALLWGHEPLLALPGPQWLSDCWDGSQQDVERRLRHIFIPSGWAGPVRAAYQQVLVSFAIQFDAIIICVLVVNVLMFALHANMKLVSQPSLFQKRLQFLRLLWVFQEYWNTLIGGAVARLHVESTPVQSNLIFWEPNLWTQDYVTILWRHYI